MHPNPQLDRIERYPHLERAPITEAILDVRVRARRDLDASEFRSVADELKSEFPRIDERRGFQTVLQFGPGSPQQASTVDMGLSGLFFWSADGRDVAQFRVDGFSLNRLKPYQSWKDWFPRFVRLWSLYQRVARPDGVTRVGCRCINHIALPGEAFELAVYLSAPPKIPEGLPQAVASFVTSVALKAEDLAVDVTITQQLQASETGPQLLLDIDAFRLGDLQAGEVEPAFEGLHDMRNRAFFRSITRQTEDLLK